MGRHAPDAPVSGARAGLIAAALLMAFARPAAAQIARFAFEPVVAVDADAGSDVPRTSGVWIDLFSAFRVAEGLDLVARPVIIRRTFDGTWQTQMFALGARYERPGRVGLRIDAGQMPSPIGLGILENRMDINPVISQHSAYYLPLPRVDEIPRTFLIAGAYPFGAQVTLSTRAWDARAAVVDSSPVRGRPFFDAGGQPRMLNVIAGGGITPRPGLRIGAAIAHGGYVAAGELDAPGVDTPLPTADRRATMVQVEGEWAFGYTKFAGEIVRNAMETARADAVASGGWLEVTQILTPRVFVAGRADAQRFAWDRLDGSRVAERYTRFEAIAGLRLTPDLTLRGGYMVRKGYVVFHWDDQVLVSLVWHRKVL